MLVLIGSSSKRSRPQPAKVTVATTFFSVAFLGFSFSARIAGTNWDGEASALENYVVESVPGEKGAVTFTVKHKVTQESIKAGSKLLPGEMP